MLRGRGALLAIALGVACVASTSEACSTDDAPGGVPIGGACELSSDCAPPTARDVEAAGSATTSVRCQAYADGKINVHYSFCQLVADGKLGQPCVETRRGSTFVAGVGPSGYGYGSQERIVYSCDLAHGLRCRGTCLPPARAGGDCSADADCEPPLTCLCDPTGCRGSSGTTMVVPEEKKCR